MSQEEITGKIRKYFELNENLKQHTKTYGVGIRWGLEANHTI